MGDDKDILPLVKGQITPWIGKQLFAIAPPGCTEPLLYTPASASMKRWSDPAVLSDDEKLDRVLVPLVPKDAKIKMTVLQNITADGDTEAMDDKQYGEALHRSLRHELMMICHAMQLPHASRADTMQALRAMAYWPSAGKDVETICDTCDTCLANRDPMTRLGSSMTSTQRFGVMMIDKIVFDDDVAEITGMPAALLMTCPRVNDAQIGLCTSMTGVEAARVIYCTGIPQFLIPMFIMSDSEPAFASEVMQELARIFGAKQWDFGPVSSPQHHGQIERRVEPYNRAIKGAMAAGMITCWRTLEVVLASALITQTQLMVTYGSTAFTRRTGAVPRTHRELYTTSCDNCVELKATFEEDNDVLAALQFYVNELCDWHQHKRDMAHRKSLYPKLSAIAKQLGTDFYLVEGDMVSYRGEKWLFLEVTGSPNQPMTAKIQQATHADEWRSRWSNTTHCDHWPACVKSCCTQLT